MKLATAMHHAEGARSSILRTLQRLQDMPMGGSPDEVELLHDLGSMVNKVYEVYMELEATHVPDWYLHKLWEACERAEDEMEARDGARRLLSASTERPRRVRQR